MKTILSFTLILLATQLLQASDLTWQGNKITPKQPFPARVIGVASSWVGYELLLEEVGVDSPRYCYVNIAMTFPINYVITPKENASKLLINAPKSTWVQIDPPVLVNDFSYEASGLYKLGKKYRDKDLLITAIANTNKENKSDMAKPKKPSD